MRDRPHEATVAPMAMDKRAATALTLILVVGLLVVTQFAYFFQAGRRPAEAPSGVSANGQHLGTSAAGLPQAGAGVSQVPGFACEAPYSSDVNFHVVIPLLNRAQYPSLAQLGMLGLTGADIYVYIREAPENDQRVEMELPCGMKFHERLLVPNLGEEGAVIVTHVASVYDQMPDAVTLLHGGPIHTWHALCTVLIRRLRAFYRGLGVDASPTFKSFASQIVTLNACKAGYNLDNCCGTLLCGPREAQDTPTCPWQRVGSLPNATVPSEQAWPEALCQLRSRTPSTNWTVAASDVPEFYLKTDEILRKYEADPLQRVPITHERLLAPLATDPQQASTAPAAKLPGARGSDGVLRKEAVPAANRRLASIFNSNWTFGSENLTNAKDELFEWARERDLAHVPHMDYQKYGMDKFWNWMLNMHGLKAPFDYKPAAHQTHRTWCCLQFTAPKQSLQIAPKQWWLDVAWLMTHIAWKKRGEWPVILGQMTEYNFISAMGQVFTTLEDNELYVAIEREMGRDDALQTCEEVSNLARVS